MGDKYSENYSCSSFIPRNWDRDELERKRKEALTCTKCGWQKTPGEYLPEDSVSVGFEVYSASYCPICDIKKDKLDQIGKKITEWEKEINTTKDVLQDRIDIITKDTLIPNFKNDKWMKNIMQMGKIYSNDFLYVLSTEMKKIEALLKETPIGKNILLMIASKTTKEQIKDELNYTVYQDKEEVRKILRDPFLKYCKMNEEKFYSSELWEIVRTFGWRVSWSTLYKKRANDIDIFFTNKEAYDEFISFLKTAPGKNKFAYRKKEIARYQYVEDQSVIEYVGKKIDVSLVSHFQEIDEILSSKPEIMNDFINSFKKEAYRKEKETCLDINKFNPATKSFGCPYEKEKSIWYNVYKIPNDSEKLLNRDAFDCPCWWSAG